jgi:hypothetical protein
MKFMAIRLTTAELNALRLVAESRRREMRHLVYPLVLEYLRDCAMSSDWEKLRKPGAVAEDQYWGTARELEEPRELPQGYVAEAKSDRDRQLQQVLEPEAHAHLRAIKQYYRVQINDLVASAIEHALKKMEGLADL